MKIALVVPGRFHAFDLARALLAIDHDVTVITNYPRFWPARFGVPPEHVRSVLSHGIAARAALRVGRLFGTEQLGEASLHRWFGRRAEQEVEALTPDVVHCFSGVAEEHLSYGRRGPSQIHSLVRGSSHIRVQRRILEEEEARTGLRINKPSAWMIAREEREYALADLIITLSRFAFDTFLEQGVAREKLAIVPLGVDVSTFAAKPEDIAARRARILSGQKLRVLTTGTLSPQKGIFDYAAVVREHAAHCDFVLRGNVTPDASGIYEPIADRMTVLPRVPQARLYEDYKQADLFFLPTLQDGFAAVLAQAAAAGLPILATTNCGAAELVTDGQDGWIVPIRRADLASERIAWCDRERALFAAVADEAARPRPAGDWRDRARDLMEIYEQLRASKSAS